MPLRHLFTGSPLGTVGILLLKYLRDTIGYSAVFVTQIGLNNQPNRAVHRDAVC
jgi:hypothetical protein